MPDQEATAHSHEAPHQRCPYDEGDVEGGGNLGGHRENDAYVVLADRGVGRAHEGGIDLGVRYIVESLASILPAGRLGRDRRPASGPIQGAPGIALCCGSFDRAWACRRALASEHSTRMSPIPALPPGSG